MKVTIEDAKDFHELLRAVAELGRVLDVQYPPVDGSPLTDGHSVTVTARLPQGG